MYAVSLTNQTTNISKYATCSWLYDLMYFLILLSYFAYAFNIYCHWVVWSGSELNMWPSSYNTNLQGDLHASRFGGISFRLTASKVEESHSFHMTAFMWRDLITASMWKDLILFIHILSEFTFTCTYHMLEEFIIMMHDSYIFT